MEDIKQTRWSIVAFLFGLGMLGAAQIFKMAPALPEIRLELNLSLVAGGILFSIINITPALIGVGAGSLADHFGYRRTLITSLFGLALSGFVGSYSDSGVMMLTFRFLEGVSVLGIIVTSPAMMSSITAPHQRNLTLSIWSSYMPTGAAIMLLVAPLLLEEYGWRQVWRISASVALVMGLIMIFAVKTPKLATHKKTIRDLFTRLRDVLSQPVPWLLTLSFLFYTAIQGPMMAWLPTFLIEDRGISTITAGMLAAIVIFSNVGGALMGGVLLARGVTHWMLICCAGLLVLVSSYGIFGENIPDWIRFISCIVAVGFTGILPTAALASVPAFAPSQDHVATLNGMIVQGAQGGHFVGPPLYAWVVHNADGDWSSAGNLFVIFSLFIIGLGLFLWRYSLKSLKV